MTLQKWSNLYKTTILTLSAIYSFNQWTYLSLKMAKLCFHDAEDASSNTCKEARQIERSIEQFAERGLKLRKGRWMEQEKKILNDNFIDIVPEHEEEIGE